jgi:hypothetical protein
MNMPLPMGPQADADLFVRMLQHYNLTYDSCGPRQEILLRPDLVFCEYEVQLRYIIKDISGEPPLPVLSVQPSFFKVHRYSMSHVITFWSTILATDGSRIKTLLDWPDFAMKDGTWSSFHSECQKVFAHRFIQLSNKDLSISLNAGRTPSLPPEYLKPYELKRRSEGHPHFEDPFVTGSHQQYEEPST